jgi:formate dehydrogenase major subunit
MAMITGRVLEHWHTGSMTRRASVLHQINPVPVVSMHPEDASAIGVQPNGSTAVLIRSRQGEVTAYVQIDEAVAVGTLFMPFAFYEAAANVLTADKLDPTGKIPEFKHTPVSVQKTTAQPVVSGYAS